MKRENRYIVIKRKHLDLLTDEAKEELGDLLIAIGIARQPDMDTGARGDIDCVVVEKDWPMYEDVWRLVEDWVDCKPGGKASTADLWRKYKSTDNPVTKSSLQEILDRRLGVSDEKN